MYSDTENRKIVCVVGPTACHKTETAILLAKRLCGEVVSADSVQVYRGMDIGSAKPTIEERGGIPHHLIDCVDIDDADFSVSRFREMAKAAIDDIHARGKAAIVVGGSGLYVQSLVNPLNFAIPSDPEIRKQLNEAYDRSPEQLMEQLRACDPRTGERLHINDKKRIVRALEVFEVGKKPLSSYGDDFRNEAGNRPMFDSVMVGLDMEREKLYERIEKRVDTMYRNGLAEEARRIYGAGYSRTLPAMQSIGYRQLFSCFDGECSIEEAVEQIKTDTRHFAKRQLTWFRRDQRIRWFDVTSYDECVLNEIYRYAEEQYYADI